MSLTEHDWKHRYPGDCLEPDGGEVLRGPGAQHENIDFPGQRIEVRGEMERCPGCRRGQVDRLEEIAAAD